MDSVLCNTPLSFILNQKRALMNVTSHLDLDYRQASYLAPELVYNYTTSIGRVQRCGVSYSFVNITSRVHFSCIPEGVSGCCSVANQSVDEK